MHGGSRLFDLRQINFSGRPTIYQTTAANGLPLDLLIDASLKPVTSSSGNAGSVPTDNFKIVPLEQLVNVLQIKITF